MTEDRVRHHAAPGGAQVTGLRRFGLEGRHVVVTGGGRGIGRAVAVVAASAGAAVTVVSRTASELADTRREIEDAGGTCRIYPADLADTDGLPRIADDLWSYAPIDGVVHAAGVQVRKDAVDVTPDDWDLVLAVNVKAPYFLSTAIARLQLADDRPGSHVFIGSLNSSIGLPRISPYVASKSALLGVTRALSTEWAAHGIRSNIIGPGYFDTALTRDLLKSEADRTRVMGRIPMRRLGATRDIGDAAVFLLGDASGYVSGQLLNVDGGWLAS